MVALEVFFYLVEIVVNRDRHNLNHIFCLLIHKPQLLKTLRTSIAVERDEVEVDVFLAEFIDAAIYTGCIGKAEGRSGGAGFGFSVFLLNVLGNALMLVDFCCVLYRVESDEQAAGLEVVVVECVVDTFQKHHFLQSVVGYGKAVRQRLLGFHRAF